MISLITGIPGAGKSLLAVELIRDVMASATPRPIYTNINGLDYDSLRCFPLEDPISWHDLPDGSMVVIDECQRYFPPRPNGSKVPDSVAKFETHRHQGLDIVLITQHPLLVDQNIRRLVEHHQHCYRPFGMSFRTVMEWNVCNDNPTPKLSEKDAGKKKKPFDKSLYQYYESASVHTHKVRWPVKHLAMAAGCVAVVAFCTWKVYSNFAAERPAQPVEPVPVVFEAPAPEPEPESDWELFYRGSIAGPHGVSVWLEDPESGRYYDLQDFDGYHKVGGYLTEFTRSNGAGQVVYAVFSPELYSILP